MLIHAERPFAEAWGKPLPKTAPKEKTGTTSLIPQQARGCGIRRKGLFNAAYSKAHPHRRGNAIIYNNMKIM
jgi:hypothetical protein